LEFNRRLGLGIIGRLGIGKWYRFVKRRRFRQWIGTWIVGRVGIPEW